MDKLTPRQREVARLLAQGKSQVQIARLLNVEVCTVYTYTKRMRDRTQLSTGQIIAKAGADNA